ncbi:MAG: DUF3379 family protein [Proteobacteria bacterium]|nr:DUF3379 family protein [Pseudomonadota bacterium]MDA0992258.1 DUF3379 family protein [Pseudomonadota bacterium]
MNCEDYKEALAGDPSASIDGGDLHLAACESCAAFTAEMQAFDAKIAKALAIDVPDLRIPELPEIEDDNVTSLPFRTRQTFSAPAWIGIAATVVLAAFIGVRMIDFDPGNGLTLSEEVLAHVDHEPGALRVTNVAVSDERFLSVVNPSVGTMDRNVGLVTYAQSCIINGKTIPHLVIQGEKGPITLLLMPEEMIDGAITLDGKGVNGVIIPMGNGSIAIIAERDEPLGEIEQRILDSVEWSI